MTTGPLRSTPRHGDCRRAESTRLWSSVSESRNPAFHALQRGVGDLDAPAGGVGQHDLAVACNLFHEWTIEDASNMRVYEPFPVARDGEVVLSDAPGWGVEISDATLQRMERRISTL